MGPLTINAEQMLESDTEQIISDTQQSGQDEHIKDINGKVFNTIDSDQDLARNFSSSTEIDKETQNLPETNLRRSKRLTKTNPVIRLNNPVNQSNLITGNTAKRLHLSPPLETSEETLERDSEENQ